MPRYHIVIVDGEQEDVKGLGECREQVAHYLFFLHSCRPLLSLSLYYAGARGRDREPRSFQDVCRQRQVKSQHHAKHSADRVSDGTRLRSWPGLPSVDYRDRGACDAVAASTETARCTARSELA